MPKIYVYAPNVASGGGLVLLRSLVRAYQGRTDVVLMLDQRGREYLNKEVNGLDCQWFYSSVKGRLQAELSLRRLTTKHDTILCFHNLPPVFNVKGRIICYVHNANLVGLVPIAILSGWVRARYFIERRIASHRKFAVERYVVQTPTMRLALRDWYGKDVPPIDLLPFISIEDSGRQDAPDISTIAKSPENSGWDFIYVSDGSAHKNHRRLFEAWRYLADRQCYPTLALTLHPQRDADLCQELEHVVATTGARIENLGQIAHHEVLQLYSACRALIFPSVAESFGIPLIEAQAAGLPILAPELDYVRDICTPVQTFDPQSARSIARAALRFLGAPEEPIQLLDGNGFVKSLDKLVVLETHDGA